MPIFGKSKELQLMETNILPKVEAVSQNVFQLISTDQELRKTAEDLLAQIAPISDRIDKVLQNLDRQVKEILEAANKAVSIFRETGQSYRSELDRVVENALSLSELKETFDETMKMSEELKRKEEILENLEKELGRFVEIQSEVTKNYEELSRLHQTVSNQVEQFQSINDDIYNKLNLICDETEKQSTIFEEINEGIERLAAERNKLREEYENIRFQQQEVDRQLSEVQQAEEAVQSFLQVRQAMEEEHNQRIESELQMISTEKQRVEEIRTNVMAKETYLSEYQDRITDLIEKMMKICEKIPEDIRVEIEEDMAYLQEYRYRRW